MPSLSYTHPHLVGRIDEHTGYKSVFARDALKRGELLIVWGGQILHQTKVLDVPPEHRRYLTQVDDELFQFTHANEPAEWINHSCAPNAGISGQIAVIAMRDIAAGEEVTFDYAMIENNTFDHEMFDCHCQQPQCRGRVTAKDWRRPELQERYQGFFALHVQKQIANSRGGL